mgnify:CR=1 FL=1
MVKGSRCSSGFYEIFFKNTKYHHTQQMSLKGSLKIFTSDYIECSLKLISNYTRGAR